MSDPLNKIVKQLQSDANRTPPVHLWNPDFCGDIDILIAQDGTWYYHNSPIGRASLVKLFSSVIRLDPDGDYYLVTPVEKLRIRVEVAPFVAIALEEVTENNTDFLRFTTKEGYSVLVDESHPIKLVGQGENIKPLVNIRSNLDALIHRNIYYQLVEMATTKKQGDLTTFGVTSGNCFFPISEAISDLSIT